ncbi:MAG TPA: GNAT family N-acetyltransferase [Cellulomonas sp.]
MHLRPFDPSDAAPLTALLHRAYADLGAAGLNFTAVDQDEATTLRRASGGASWVVDHHDRPVATMSVSLPAEAALRALTPHAAADGRAWLNQLAVDPAHRGHGLARRLRDVGYGWCRAQRSTSIGLDTAEPAEHLVAMYTSWGFAVVDRVQWPGKRYRSVVMVRALPDPHGDPDAPTV